MDNKVLHWLGVLGPITIAVALVVSSLLIRDGLKGLSDSQKGLSDVQQALFDECMEREGVFAGSGSDPEFNQVRRECLVAAGSLH